MRKANAHRISELTQFLNSECNNALKSSKQTLISESEFQDFHKLPEKEFNKNFKNVVISEYDELKKIMLKFYISLTGIYLKQRL